MTALTEGAWSSDAVISRLNCIPAKDFCPTVLWCLLLGPSHYAVRKEVTWSHVGVLAKVPPEVQQMASTTEYVNKVSLRMIQLLAIELSSQSVPS